MALSKQELAMLNNFSKYLINKQVDIRIGEIINEAVYTLIEYELALLKITKLDSYMASDIALGVLKK